MKEREGTIAAFFDLDGTLLGGPSLERKFLSELRRLKTIGMKNFYAWWNEALRLTPRGVDAIRYANKMYVQGVATKLAGTGIGSGGFFAEGIERVAWHVELGHRVFLVSGTLEPLARRAAEELERAVFVHRGVVVKIEGCATRLEESQGKWTGRILGEAMYGEAKARAVQGLAAKLGFDLTQSYGYGNSVQDQELLEAVGKPSAVNPTRGLSRIAREKNWVVLKWNKSEIPRSKSLSYRLNSQEATATYREKAEWESLG